MSPGLSYGVLGERGGIKQRGADLNASAGKTPSRRPNAVQHIVPWKFHLLLRAAYYHMQTY